MSLVLPSLLCLGLCLGQSTQAQKGNLSPPRITALPGSTVGPKSPVTILCQGPADAEEYVISKVGSPEPSDREKQLLSKTINSFRIAEMTPDRAGLYHCSYQSGGSWSQFSDPLQLVMTGAYDKPLLSSMTGTVVASGENAKLQCFSTLKFEAFILSKEHGDRIIQSQLVSHQGGNHEAVFLLNQVSSTQTGTYRCYGLFEHYPYVWSRPSDPLHLQVREAPDYPDPMNPQHSTEAPDYPDPMNPRHSTEAPDYPDPINPQHSTEAPDYPDPMNLQHSAEAPDYPDPMNPQHSTEALGLRGPMNPRHSKESPDRGDPMNTRNSTESPDHGDPTNPQNSTASPDNQNSWEKYQNILIGVPVAITLLLLLLLLLFIFHRCKAKNNAARKERQLKDGPTDGQASEAVDPQEVTYSQVTCSVPTQGTAATPSLPRQTQTSEYAILALK
ncbi:leukocyte immunoglobulin-like receptor subfamily A member 5 isoform X4 [Equus caballus]|uniref:leukocyte immunoglobulin-like receptor subfamily A member 5 isoform X4 n=1 Tax=Equus caballus TaxID=9796 RepID=UPI0038B26728